MIKKYESFISKPYKCPAGVWTIGYGTTVYPGGKRVNQFDKPITTAQAEAILATQLITYENAVNQLAKGINQNQFDALVCFAYNLGVGALKSSTLLKKVKANPNDLTIKNEFLKWVNAGGKKLTGLIKRRTDEANLYFS